MTDYKELAKDFALGLVDCIDRNNYTNGFECRYCMSKYIDGDIVHKDCCVAKRAIEFLKEIEND